LECVSSSTHALGWAQIPQWEVALLMSYLNMSILAWAVNKADIQQIDAVDQWSLRRILDIRRHDFVRNANIRCITNQPPLSSIIESRRLTFFGHLARMDENADASQAIFEPPPENWRRPPGRPHTTWIKNIHDDLSSLDLRIHEARDLAQNRPVCRLMSLHSATHS